MSSEEIDRWATAFVDCYRDATHSDPEHPLAWANARYIDLIFDDPEACWQLVLAVLAKAPSEHAMSMLAAGPLEDVISMHGDRFIERVEDHARVNPRFRDALEGVWQNNTSAEIWERVCAARDHRR